MKRELPIARLTVRGINEMTYHQRRAIAKWMRKHARELSARGAEDRYGGRFTARHYS